jgi:hypothetical protein
MEGQGLVALTQGFLKVLAEAAGAEVELSDLKKTLSTTKRRLSDVVTVLAGIDVVQRIGKSRVRLLCAPPVDAPPSVEARERELDNLLASVESELADFSSSELFKSCAWITPTEAEAFLADAGGHLFSLRGPPSMSIAIRDNDADPNVRTIECKVEHPGEGQIRLEPIKREV